MKTQSPATLNPRILVIDDNLSVHEDFRKILTPPKTLEADLFEMESAIFGSNPLRQPQHFTAFEIDCAFQGDEGLKRVQQAMAAGRPYALAFVDGRMPPGWDGIETIGRLWRECPELQVVLCTAYADYSWQDIRRLLGESDSLLILKKPFDNVEVLQLAHTLTRKWQLNRDIRCQIDELRRTSANLKAEIERRDLAEGKNRLLEEQLRQSQKMEAIGRFAGGVAHDFNTLLGIIVGYGYMLKKEVAPNSGTREKLDELLNATDRARKLVQQLLDFARPSAAERASLDLVDVIKSSLQLLQKSISPFIEVSLELSDSARMLGVESQVQQVIMNLVFNAADAMSGKKGKITITVDEATVEPEQAQLYEVPEGVYVRMCVADTGSGMETAVIERVFEPFFTTKKNGRGTGLGLSVVYGIVKAHNGFITIRSMPGQGSVFTLFWPKEKRLKT